MGKGTGVVTSVPSDAPDDFVALKELQDKPLYREKFGLTDEVTDGEFSNHHIACNLTDTTRMDTKIVFCKKIALTDEVTDYIISKRLYDTNSTTSRE